MALRNHPVRPRRPWRAPIWRGFRPGGCRRRIAGFGARQDGATAVEFALLSPVLLLMLVGLMEFGLFFWKKHSIEFAVEETTRWVMMKSTVSAEAVSQDLKDRLLGIDPTELTATVLQETVGPTTFVSITAGYSHSFVVGSYFGFEPMLIESKSRFPLSPPE